MKRYHLFANTLGNGERYNIVCPVTTTQFNRLKNVDMGETAFFLARRVHEDSDWFILHNHFLDTYTVIGINGGGCVFTPQDATEINFDPTTF